MNLESEKETPITRIRAAIEDRERQLREADKLERGSLERMAARWRVPDRAVTGVLQLEAKAAFVALNRWRPSPQWIGVQDIGKAGIKRWDRYGEEILPARPNGGYGRQFFDHQHSYRQGGRYVALVSEPYEEPADNEADAADDAARLEQFRLWLNAMRLDLFTPPDPLPSIHNPGRTIFLVIAALGAEIRWLPEQDGRLKPLWRRANAEEDREDEAARIDS